MPGRRPETNTLCMINMINLLRILVVISLLFWSYFIIIASSQMYGIFRIYYGYPKGQDWIVLIPEITKLAIDYFWIPFSLVIITGVFSIINSYFSKIEGKKIFIMQMTLWIHFFIAWIILFCFFYVGFTGGGCLHHGPEFEMERFQNCCFGFFPITLFALLLVPCSLILNYNKKIEAATPRPDTLL